MTYTYYAYGGGSSRYWNNGGSTGAAKNPFRYRGYYYDSELQMYYLNSRYYDPAIGRFISPDSFVSTGQGLLGYNMYAYCNNNPVNGYDPTGEWTFGFSWTISGIFGLGTSFCFGFVFDDNGNFDWQYSYAVPGVDDTNIVGGVGVGTGVAIQYTNADEVYDLYGSATYVGASGGPLWYVGADAVSFSDASNLNMTMDGFQLVAGVGLGVDVHVTESYTVSALPQSTYAQNGMSRIFKGKAIYAQVLY